MNLRTRSLYIVALVLFLALSINSAVLTFVAYDRGKQAVISKVTAFAGVLSGEIEKSGPAGIPIESIGGLNEKLKNLKKDKTINYAMIIDTEGKILLHSNEEHIGNVLRDEATLRALASKGTLTQRWGDFYDISLPLIDAEEKKVGIVKVGVSSTVMKKELYNLLLVAVPLTLAGVLVCTWLIYFFVLRYVEKPIMVMEKFLRKMSTGDMTEHVALTGKDEIASLSEAINTMSAHVKNMIVKMNGLASTISATAASITESPSSVLRIVDVQKKTLKEHTHRIEEMNASIVSIAKSSENLYLSSEDETNALKEITEYFSQITESANTFYINALEAAASVEEMMSSIKETARIIEVLSASAEESTVALKEVNATMSEIHKNAKESVLLAEKVTLDASEKGLTSLNIAIQGIEDIKRSVHSIAVKINRLERRSEEIGSILHVIDEVAAQTNLLSLNAAILAAQAGEHGKSFIVVADEIKRLAEKTSASTKEIAELITTVQTETQSSVEMTSQGIETVDRGVKLIKEVDKALYSIIESSRVATEMSKSIQIATAEEANAIQQITGSIKQTTDQIDLISRATREQGKGSNIIVEASDKIRTDAEQLKRATESQSRSIKQISYISGYVSGQAKQIHVAMGKQEQMNNEIINSIGKLQETTAELIAASTEMDSHITSLGNETKALLAEIQKVKV
jgi:methyl-accepting chemotaxis protein